MRFFVRMPNLCVRSITQHRLSFVASLSYHCVLTVLLDHWKEPVRQRCFSWNSRTSTPLAGPEGNPKGFVFKFVVFDQTTAPHLPRRGLLWKVLRVTGRKAGKKRKWQSLWFVPFELCPHPEEARVRPHQVIKLVWNRMKNAACICCERYLLIRFCARRERPRFHRLTLTAWRVRCARFTLWSLVTAPSLRFSCKCWLEFSLDENAESLIFFLGKLIFDLQNKQKRVWLRCSLSPSLLL